MPPPPNWDTMRSGVGCPLCQPRPDDDRHAVGLEDLSLAEFQRFSGDIRRPDARSLPRSNLTS